MTTASPPEPIVSKTSASLKRAAGIAIFIVPAPAWRIAVARAARSSGTR